MEILDQYIVEVPSGEIMWVTKAEKRMLSDFQLIKYESGKNFWYFISQKKTNIKNVLEHQRRYYSNKES
jgi:hypothetical protein